MRRSIIAHLIFLVVASPVMGAGPLAARPMPQWGLILNEDGDIILSCADADPAVAAKNLRTALDTLKSSPVKTLTYQIGCGSDVLHYPTKVASIWGWRTTDKERSKPWDGYMAKMRPAAAAGLDSVRIAADWAKENGVYFIPSYRMNDAHYCADPANNPLTGEFWVKHHERLELKQSPVPAVENYRYLLDFSHPEVRAYRLAVIFEAIERYQDAMQGFQLDFLRHPALFPQGTAERNAPLLTDMIVQIRRKLDELGARNGRPYYLAVRVPPTLKHCHKVGLEVDRWLKDGLVDIVTPSQAMTTAYDMPVDEFAELCGPARAAVYPAILDLTQFAWPFTFTPTADSYAGSVTPIPSPALLRGALNNFRAMGAAGVEVYNYNVPLTAQGQAAMRALTDTPQGLRVYAITPRYWIDTTDAFEPVKQIPVVLADGKPVRLRLFVGEDLAAPGSIRSALRLGLHTQEPISTVEQVTITANGRALYSGPPGPIYTSVTGRQQGRGVKNHPPATTGYLQVSIKRPEMFKKGTNDLVVTIKAASRRNNCTLCEVQLGVQGGGQ